MFHIVKALVVIYSDGKYISYITAKLEDQDYEALMALGRGKMYQAAPGTNALKYSLPNGLMVMLRTS